MLELEAWIRSAPLPARPALLLGKGPSFAQIANVDRSRYNLVSLNHAVRELPVHVAHVIDIDVVEDCAEALRTNCRYLVMPRRPHVGFQAGPPLERHFDRLPVLRELDRQGRLVRYDLSTGGRHGAAGVIPVRYFSVEPALVILGRLGVKTVHSLGIDGGRGYSASFGDLERKTMLANGHQSFDGQFAEIERIAAEFGIDYQPLAAPLRVYVAGDDSQVVPARVLEHSIRSRTTQPVVVHPVSRDGGSPGLHFDAGTLVLGDVSQLLHPIVATPGSATRTLPASGSLGADVRIVEFTEPSLFPWRCDDHPLCGLWESEFRDAVAAGAVTAADVVRGVRDGDLKPSLLGAFSGDEISRATRALRCETTIRFTPRGVAGAARRMLSRGAGCVREALQAPVRKWRKAG